MKIKRRELSKLSALTGISFAGGGVLNAFVSENKNNSGKKRPEDNSVDVPDFYFGRLENKSSSGREPSKKAAIRK